MQALTVIPFRPDSLTLSDLDEPVPAAHQLLARTLAIGVCGTDREIVACEYGEAPQGAERLVIGHESLAEVISAPADSPFATGDLVVGIVRRPDPVPCANCAAGEWDMCRNGLYTEHGIKGADGYAAERFAIDADYAVKIAPTLRDATTPWAPTRWPQRIRNGCGP